MKTSIRIAALFISGAVFIGCDKKDTTTVTTPDGKTTTVTTPSAAAPTTPDTSKAADAANKMVDKGADALKTGLDKVMPATMPTVPGIGK